MYLTATVRRSKSLGPLSNPAVPSRMIVGVHSKELGQTMAEALILSGVKGGMVVCGDIGLDEVTLVFKEGHLHLCFLNANS